MLERLGLGKQTNLFRAGLRGWLYRHDWQLAGLLAVATIAAHLKDSMQIGVPLTGHCARAKKGKLDINLATREQLLLVPGMDAALADAIIKYRQDFGGFAALTELKSAMGLDATTYKQLSKPLTVP